MCAKNNNIYMWREQAIIEWSRWVNSIVASCHSVKLYAHAARAFRSQQNSTLYVDKYGCSSNCKIVPAELLPLMGKYTIPFSKSVKSDHNWHFWYVQNNHIKTTKIFSVRSSPNPAEIGFSPDPVRCSLDRDHLCNKATIAYNNSHRNLFCLVIRILQV